jgi:hypothetical protein
MVTPGPPMTLGNCLNHACRHDAMLDAASYPGE